MDARSEPSIMRLRRASIVAVVIVTALSIVPCAAFATDETLAQAKELYAAAAYDEALAVLDRLDAGTPPSESRTIAEYRVFCLLALDRRKDAHAQIENILRADPSFTLSDQASPRIRNIFGELRNEALRTIVRERYEAAKAAFDRKDPDVRQQFDAVLELMDQPDVKTAPGIEDLRIVAAAFRDLTEAIATTEAKAAAAAAAITPPPLAPLPDTIYTASDADVVSPIPRTQQIPPWTPTGVEATRDYHGSLGLLIDETGAVASVTLLEGIHVAYNQRLMRAARGWTFTPARRQGVPVRYMKVVEVHLTPRGTPPPGER
jgi:hypothetical protein